MSIKTKLTLAMATMAVGATAALGGTFAYFSSDSTSHNEFTNGTVVLRPGTAYLERFTINNFKPGDLLNATFVNQEPAWSLNNHGTLPFNVLMEVTSNESDGKGFDEHLIFTELKFNGQDLIAGLNGGTEISLKDLAEKTASKSHQIKDAEGNVTTTLDGYMIGNIPVSSTRNVTYKIVFRDNGEDQNYLQGAQAPFDVKFTAVQEDGTLYNKDNLSNGTPGSGGGNWEPTN
ncbi:TasA family protein [Brevibacillus sp. B_LB10_24]|uniref:TasA family protein n=1 Tax=Brevibacillus sp. B_LB10_24 TaxID=3380645 RepID=UPI0038BBCDA3